MIEMCWTSVGYCFLEEIFQMIVVQMLNELELRVWDERIFHIFRIELLLLNYLKSLYLKVFRGSLGLQTLTSDNFKDFVIGLIVDLPKKDY